MKYVHVDLVGIMDYGLLPHNDLQLYFDHLENDSNHNHKDPKITSISTSTSTSKSKRKSKSKSKSKRLLKN